MNAKEAKKLRKEVRKSVDRNFGVGMEALARIIRRKPRWIPKKIWILAYAPLFPKKYLSLIYKYL
jgi:hypothetical protein